MEIEGHPTQDLVEELQRRGATRVPGSGTGPDPDALRALAERLDGSPGTWLFLPPHVYETGFDEFPA